MLELKPGMVAALFSARARARNQDEWERDVEGIWDRAVELLERNPGFKGLVALWNTDQSRDVFVMGVWESLEARLKYEAAPAAGVRALFNSIFEQVPHRPRYVVTRSHTHP